MVKVIGVRFKRVGKVYYFLPGSIAFKQGDYAIVETAKGQEYGEVVLAEKEVSEDNLVAPLKKVVRRATSKDEKKIEDNKAKEKEALEVCSKKIEKHELDMKLVDVEYTFDNSKIVFYFTADGRVDFRDLVKDLAGIFKTRIELRQIGVRDEAKMLGGLGPCGRACCCSYFLGDFSPVSIKMAKEQNLSLSPTKISGLCGRLMCCLNYEHEHYCETQRRMPRQGSTVETPHGQGMVIDNNAITEKVRVKIVLPDESYDIETFDLADIKTVRNCPRQNTARDDDKQTKELETLLDEPEKNGSGRSSNSDRNRNRNGRSSGRDNNSKPDEKKLEEEVKPVVEE
jgi:cell fate regulator YaaT (PSP1 superfamily)